MTLLPSSGQNNKICNTYPYSYKIKQIILLILIVELQLNNPVIFIGVLVTSSHKDEPFVHVCGHFFPPMLLFVFSLPFCPHTNRLFTSLKTALRKQKQKKQPSKVKIFRKLYFSVTV